MLAITETPPEIYMSGGPAVRVSRSCEEIAAARRLLLGRKRKNA